MLSQLQACAIRAATAACRAIFFEPRVEWIVAVQLGVEESVRDARSVFVAGIGQGAA
jgi:hypothetical protein